MLQKTRRLTTINSQTIDVVEAYQLGISALSHAADRGMPFKVFALQLALAIFLRLTVSSLSVSRVPCPVKGLCFLSGSCCLIAVFVALLVILERTLVGWSVCIPSCTLSLRRVSKRNPRLIRLVFAFLYS